jgi:DNA-dependent RNA polymerase auxiliary subunit epsilon
MSDTKTELRAVIRRIDDVKTYLPIDSPDSVRALVDEIEYQMDVAIQLANDAIGKLEKEAKNGK